MKIVKRVFLGILSIAIIVGISLALFKRVQKQRILNIVRSGHVMVDQEIHEWNVCESNSPVRIKMYVRNTSEYKITGNLVFSTTLSRKGLEERFLRALVNCFGEENLKREGIETGSTGRAQAIYNYIMRGKKLPQGQGYEPSTENVDKDYTFKFRKQLLLGPGEIFKVEHEEQIPLNERGYLLTVKIENIEF